MNTFEKSLRDLGWKKPEKLDVEYFTDEEIALLRFTNLSAGEEKEISDLLRKRNEKKKYYTNSGDPMCVYLRDEWMVNKSNEPQIRAILADLMSDIKTEESLTNEQAIKLLEDLDEKIIVKMLNDGFVF